MRVGVVVAIALLGGCYRTSTFVGATGNPFVGVHTHVGCLDVAIALTDDRTAPPPILAYTFGNGCGHETIVDFSAIRAVGLLQNGVRVPLVAYDPKHELEPLQLDAHATGEETIAYQAPIGSVPPTICVDIGHLDARATTGAHWVCSGAIDNAQLEQMP